MKDRNVEFPDRYRLIKVPGTDDVYDLIPAPGEVREEGTFINKANLLTDETAAAIKPYTGTTPDTPNDALAAIAKSLTDRPRIETGEYAGAGTYGETNKNHIRFGFVPKLVIIYTKEFSFPTFFTKDISAIHTWGNDFPIGANATVEWNNTDLYWYSGTKGWAYNTGNTNITTASWYPLFQLNSINTTYNYIAIG